MATLVRPRIISSIPLESTVPTPFPTERLGLLKGKAVDKDVNPFEAEGSAENPFEDEVAPPTLAESGIATPNTYTLVQTAIVFSNLFIC